MRYLSFILLFTVGTAMMSCGTQESATQGDEEVISSQEDMSEYRDLADFLRRLPGIQVRGAGDNVNIQIRGTSSFNSETRPLYIVDGRVMGNSYSEVNRAISMSEVSSVRVLNESESASYGVRGSNGVIEITLK